MARRSSRTPGSTARSTRRAGAPGGSRPLPAAPTTTAGSHASVPDAPAGLAARLAFALGAMAFLALPISYQWTFRPASRPAGSDVLIPLIELGGVIAAAAALLLGRRARAAGDRSSGAVWGPRLGAASIVGYAMVFFLLTSQSL